MTKLHVQILVVLMSAIYTSYEAWISVMTVWGRIMPESRAKPKLNFIIPISHTHMNREYWGLFCGSLKVGIRNLVEIRSTSRPLKKPWTTWRFSSSHCSILYPDPDREFGLHSSRGGKLKTRLLAQIDAIQYVYVRRIWETYVYVYVCTYIPTADTALHWGKSKQLLRFPHATLLL